MMIGLDVQSLNGSESNSSLSIDDKADNVVKFNTS